MKKEEIHELLQRTYGINGIEHGADIGISETKLAGIYEGNGRWPDFVRPAVEKSGDLFEPAGIILDADFHKSNGNIYKLHEVTERFKRNLKTIYDYMCPLFSLRMFLPSYRRYRKNARIAMEAMSIAVSDGYVRKKWEEGKGTF